MDGYCMNGSAFCEDIENFLRILSQGLDRDSFESLNGLYGH